MESKIESSIDELIIEIIEINKKYESYFLNSGKPETFFYFLKETPIQTFKNKLIKNLSFLENGEINSWDLSMCSLKILPESFCKN